MNETVIIRVGRDDDSPVPWAVSRDGAVSGSGRAKNLAALTSMRMFARENIAVAAILPGELAAFRVLPSPPRQQSKLVSAAQLLLEDELAAPLDDHHIAIQRDDAHAQIIAIKRDVVASLRSTFQDKGVSLSYVTIDYLCLGGDEHRAVLFAEPNRLVANFGTHAFSSELDIAKFALADRLAALPEAKVGVYAGGGAFADHSRYERLGEGGDEALLSLAAKAIAEQRAINLLQGEFRPPRKTIVDIARWRRPAMMAASLAAVWMAGVFADGFRASRAAERYESEAARIHAEAFPNAGNVDIRAHARGVLGAGGDASFLLVADTLGKALSAHENVAIDRIRFDRTRNMFVFSVRSTSDGEISSFQETLASLGATSAETGGYRRAGAYWVGEMTVTI